MYQSFSNKVLLVEDDSDLFYLLNIFLDSEGLTVVPHQTFIQCFSPLPGAIVCDLDTIKLGTYALLKKFLSSLEAESIPLIALVDSQSSEVFPYIKTLGASHFLTKPIDFEKLLSLINLHAN